MMDASFCPLGQTAPAPLFSLLKNFRQEFEDHISGKCTRGCVRWVSFGSETAIFRNFGVNLRACWCGERLFASAQPLDFLDLAKNISFLNPIL